MIQKLETRNYHSHKNTIIEFDPGVNIIAGSSDAGKSDILRQIRWVNSNRPMGDSVSSWWNDKEDETSVCLTLPEGSCTKKRSSGKSIYEVSTTTGKTTLEAVKTDVPTEVSDLFNFSEFNYQSQHSEHFLLSESPGEVAKKLNELVGLEIIDVMFKNLASKALDHKRKSEEETKKSEDLKLEIDKLGYIDKISEELQSIKLIMDNFDINTVNLSKLSGVISDCEIVQDKIKEYSKILLLERQCKSLKDIVQTYKSLQNKVLSITGILVRVQDSQRIIAKEIPLLSIEDDVKGLLDRIDRKIVKENKQKHLKNLITAITETQGKIKSENEWLQVDSKHKEIKSLIADYQSKKDSYLKLKKLVMNCKLATNMTSEINKVNELIEKKQVFLIENKMCPLCKTPLTLEIIKGML